MLITIKVLRVKKVMLQRKLPNEYRYTFKHEGDRKKKKKSTNRYYLI